MRRRAFLAALGSAAAWPLGAQAQQPGRLRRIGVLMGIADGPLGQAYVTALLDGLRDLGWSDGQNISIDIRWAAGNADQIRTLAKELIDRRPDLIVGQNTPVVAALLQETRTLPVVFVNVADPIGSGFVLSFPRPGGNVTGFMGFELSLGGKWLELLTEIAPRITRVAFIFNPQVAAYSPLFLRSAEAGTAASGIRVVAAPVHNVTEIEYAVGDLARETYGGLIMLPDNFTTVHRERIIELSARHRIPAVYPFRYIPAEGGLMSYGHDVTDLHRRAATYVDRVPQGRAAGGPPRAGADQVCLGHQSQNRQGTRPRNPRDPARPCRRGD